MIPRTRQGRAHFVSPQKDVSQQTRGEAGGPKRRREVGRKHFPPKPRLQLAQPATRPLLSPQNSPLCMGMRTKLKPSPEGRSPLAYVIPLGQLESRILKASMGRRETPPRKGAEPDRAEASEGSEMERQGGIWSFLGPPVPFEARC